MATMQLANTQTSAPFAPKPSAMSAPKAATTFAKPAIPKQSDRVRTYKDFLTPALHRRFTRSAAILIAVCYLESILIRTPSILWVWNPFSTVGVRAVLLFIPCLAVFIARVANLHVGEQTATSGAAAAYDALTSLRTAHTLAWYVGSAWFFGELYIWSRASSAHLAWVDPGREYERPRLNENPIFLRSYLFCLGIAQTALHLARGYDRLELPAIEEQAQLQRPLSRLPSSLQDLSARMPTIAGRVLRLVLPGLVFTIPIYFTLIRSLVWPYFHLIGRTLHSDLPPSDKPTGIGVDHVFQLAWQSLFSSVLLVLLWEISNAIFTIYVSLPPLKRNHPLTSEIKDTQGNVVNRSKDPNASLLSGLKSKKEVPKTFAFWELWLIASTFETRRKTIFTEVDRELGSTWEQLSKLCLGEIDAVKERVKLAREPADMKQQQEAKALQRRQQENLIAQQQEQPLGLPKIADRKVLDGDVWQNGKPASLKQSVGQVAKSVGQSSNSRHPVSPHAWRALEWGRDRIMSKEDQDRLSRRALTQEAGGLAIRFLQTPIGEPFRQTFAQASCRVVLGHPNSRKATIVLATKTLSRLAVCSLKEDNYGQVAKSIPAILRALTSTITEVEGFTAALPPSWSDVYFTQRDRENVADIREVLAVLRASLEEVLLAFSEYAAAIGVTKVDLRRAQEALGKGSEMMKV